MTEAGRDEARTAADSQNSHVMRGERYKIRAILPELRRLVLFIR